MFTEFKNTLRVSFLLMGFCVIAIFCISADADDLKESEHARILFSKSLEYLTGDRTPPTYQGLRNVTLVGLDGLRKKFQIFDGFSMKYDGYHARLEKGARPMQKGKGPEGKDFGPPGGMPGPPPGGGPGGPGGPRGPGGPGGGQGGPPPNPRGGPGGPMPGMEEQPDDEIGILSRLINFDRPDMSPIIGAQQVTARNLIKDSKHLVIKGPVSSEVAGRKTYMLDISPRFYKGASIRIWLDVETLLPLKKERINTNGILQYLSEYSDFKLVDDKDFAFKDEKNQPELPGMFGPPGRMERPVPRDIMNRDLKINQQVTISKETEGFELISIRKIPLVRLPGIHYVFSDGLNTISVFHFYNKSSLPQKKLGDFIDQLCKRLEKELKTPVLNKKDRKNIFIVTADISREDLAKIAKNIALQNVDSIKKRIKKELKQP